MLRLRAELQKLLSAQAARLSDAPKSTAYLSTQYESLLAGVSVSGKVSKSDSSLNVNDRQATWSGIKKYNQRSHIGGSWRDDQPKADDSKVAECRDEVVNTFAAYTLLFVVLLSNLMLQCCLKIMCFSHMNGAI